MRKKIIQHHIGAGDLFKLLATAFKRMSEHGTSTDVLKALAGDMEYLQKNYKVISK